MISGVRRDDRKAIVNTAPLCALVTTLSNGESPCKELPLFLLLHRTDESNDCHRIAYYLCELTSSALDKLIINNAIWKVKLLNKANLSKEKADVRLITKDASDQLKRQGKLRKR